MNAHACCLVVACSIATAQVPTPAELRTLLADYVAATAAMPPDLKRQDEILRRLDLVPPLAAPAVKQWQTELVRLAAKGRTLDPKPGPHFFWEKPERGRYVVGGETKAPQGLLIGLHGGGEGSGEAYGAHSSLADAARRLDWVAVFPEVLDKVKCAWTESAGTEGFVLDLIAAARRTWKIDADRVFLFGHSMGGNGAWMLGSRHADLLAALAPSAGNPNPIVGADGNAKAIWEGVIPNVRNLAMVVYHGAEDRVVPPAGNRFTANAIEQARERWGGFPFEYWEAAGQGHSEPPGGVIAHLQKVARHVRTPRSAKVVWQPVLPWKRQFYWLWWDAPVHGSLVVAEVDRDRNTVKVECDTDPTGLCVLLDEQMVDFKRELVVTCNGTNAFVGRPQPNLTALALTAARNDPRLTFTCRIPLKPR